MFFGAADERVARVVPANLVEVVADVERATILRTDGWRGLRRILLAALAAFEERDGSHETLTVEACAPLGKVATRASRDCYNPRSFPAMSEPSTPLMRQYTAIKKEHPNALLFFRLGDFYELFFEDAVVAATRVANHADLAQQGEGHRHSDVRRALPLGGKLYCQAHPQGLQGRHLRADGRPARGQEAGEARGHARGHAGHGRGCASRLGGEQLSGLRGARGKRRGFAALDLSTGEFRATEFRGDDAERRVREELLVLRPREVLFASSLPLFDQPRAAAPQAAAAPRMASLENATWAETPLDDWVFAPDYAIPQVENHFGVLSLEGLAWPAVPPRQPPREQSCITCVPRSAARSIT